GHRIVPILANTWQSLSCQTNLPPSGYGLPTPGHSAVLLRFRLDPFLGAELLISLMFALASDVNDAGFLVFISIVLFALHFGALDLFIWKRRIELLLLCGLRRADVEARGGKHCLCVVCLRLGLGNAD